MTACLKGGRRARREGKGGNGPIGLYGSCRQHRVIFQTSTGKIVSPFLSGGGVRFPQIALLTEDSTHNVLYGTSHKCITIFEPKFSSNFSRKNRDYHIYFGDLL